MPQLSLHSRASGRRREEPSSWKAPCWWVRFSLKVPAMCQTKRSREEWDGSSQAHRCGGFPPDNPCKLPKALPGPGARAGKWSHTSSKPTQSTRSETKLHFPIWVRAEKLQFWKASDCCFSNKLNRWIGNSIYCLFPQHINMWGASINYGLTANKPTHAKAIE